MTFIRIACDSAGIPVSDLDAHWFNAMIHLPIPRFLKKTHGFLHGPHLKKCLTSLKRCSLAIKLICLK